MSKAWVTAGRLGWMANEGPIDWSPLPEESTQGDGKAPFSPQGLKRGSYTPHRQRHRTKRTSAGQRIRAMLMDAKSRN